MRATNLLFFEEGLDTQLCARQPMVCRTVDKIPEDQFLIARDQELGDHVVSRFTVKPIVLHEENKEMHQQETKVDVSHDTMRVFLHDHRSGPLYVAGTQITINVPFSGEKWIFQYRTSQWLSIFPRADVKDGFLQIKIALPCDTEPNVFKFQYEKEINLIRKYVEFAKKQIDGYNQSLPDLVQDAIKRRRDRLDRHRNIAELLDIPLAPRVGAPSIEPVKVEIRRPHALPVPPKTGLRPEPGITDETYEHVLQFIRHQGRTFERTPGIFAVHGEDDLRHFILAQLNGHFQGAANSEVFRCKVKTDICIEENNRAAFIGECKLWTGPKGLTNALDQLLGYLTWRDSKAALIIFNKDNKDFTRILDSIPETLPTHPLFLKDLTCREKGEGEWRVQMRSSEDEGRRVSVHTFVFNLHIP